jgi:hypothetical protein
MHKSFLATLATAAIVTGAMIAGPAQAMTTASPSAGAVTAIAAAAPIRLAAVVCGGTGCVTVQTKQIQHRKFHPLGHS